MHHEFFSFLEFVPSSDHALRKSERGGDWHMARAWSLMERSAFQDQSGPQHGRTTAWNKNQSVPNRKWKFVLLGSAQGILSHRANSKAFSSA